MFKTLRVDSHGILHFVLVWFCLGLVLLWFGFVVVWFLRLLKTSGNFRFELQERCGRTAVFHFNGRDPVTSFFSLHCHGLMDFELTSCFGFGNFTPDANFSWQI